MTSLDDEGVEHHAILPPLLRQVHRPMVLRFDVARAVALLVQTEEILISLLKLICTFANRKQTTFRSDDEILMWAGKASSLRGHMRGRCC